MSSLKKYLIIFMVFLTLLLTACTQQDASATEPSVVSAEREVTGETTVSTQPQETEAVDSTDATVPPETEPEQTQPPVLEPVEIEYAFVKNPNTLVWEMQSENLQVSIANGREATVTLTGIDLQDEYLIHPYEQALTGKFEFNCVVRVHVYNISFWICMYSHPSYEVDEALYMQYDDEKVAVPFLIYCKDQGIMPVAEELPMKVEDMYCQLYIQNGSRFWDTEDIRKMEYTQDSITWTFTIPEKNNHFDIKQVSRIDVKYNDELLQKYLLRTDGE